MIPPHHSLPRALATTLATVLLTAAVPAKAEWQSLFNGKDLDGWRPLLDAPGSIRDYVEVADGEIHIYAKNPAPNRVPFGVLITERSFERFHLRLEYKWGAKKFEPRAQDLRDAGILYHIYDDAKVWPKSVECQIQEGDTGDLIFLSSGGVSWEHPRPPLAPPGQGDAGMLPEMGGVPRAFFRPQFGPYLGRFPEADNLKSWNTVDVIVHGAGSAVHIVNGKVRARAFDLRKPAGKTWAPLDRGPIAIQLEGAELFYRNIVIQELPPPLEVSSPYASVSMVAGSSSRPVRLSVTNPGPEVRTLSWRVFGEAPDAFVVSGEKDRKLAAGETATLEVNLKPGVPHGRLSAGLQIGNMDNGAFVVLQGLVLPGMEGTNEPPLFRILRVLGTDADVGGVGLDHDTASETLGSSVAGGWFRAKGEVSITPVARFSPPGRVPFGILLEGSTEEIILGVLADSADRKDAHQGLWPPTVGGEAVIRLAAPEKPFAFFAKPGARLCTDPGAATEAKVKHTARVWPISFFQGRVVENAYLVGFEEAANGDYQDALFLVQNVEVIPPPAKK